MDYSDLYNSYWQSGVILKGGDRDPSQIANMIQKLCGFSRVLDVGCGEGLVVGELLQRGIDAKGLDVSQVVLDRARSRLPDRLIYGSVLDLPLDNEAFEAIVAINCMEHLAEEDVLPALRELHRASSCYVILQIDTTASDQTSWHGTVRDRQWWEQACFAVGFRKHSAYYNVINYESLESEGGQILIPLEKISSKAAEQYPLESLAPERGLHMDMLRDSGDRSDAHVVRYTLASQFVRPGDRVLDAACGMGYGSHVLASLGLVSDVTGLDNSSFAIEYAASNYSSRATTFKVGNLPESLRDFADNSFDMVVSFETLEHVPDPQAVLREFMRILTPGGRIFVSVPNDWSDESGEDPNPFHLHVYDWNAIYSQINNDFIVERAFQQVATQCKIAEAGGRWQFRPRTLREISPDAAERPDSEWWLLLGMKEPNCDSTTFGDAAAKRFGTPAMDLDNPWLNASMIHFGYRMQNIPALNALCETVLKSSDRGANDHHAALCIRAYRVLEDLSANAADVKAICDAITNELDALSTNSPMGNRWTVSLLFVRGRLEQKLGLFDLALRSYESVADIDFLKASVHLATKTTEALFRAGILSLSLGKRDQAKRLWRRSLAVGDALLSVRPYDILIDPDMPNLFDHGDGIREYTLAWDFIARAANGLHLLENGPGIRPNQIDVLLNSFSHKVDVLNRELGETRETAKEHVRVIGAFSATARNFQRALTDRTEELVSVRDVLIERTTRLEAALEDLAETRALLVERTERLENAVKDLADHERDLIETRAALVERTRRLEAALEKQL